MNSTLTLTQEWDKTFPQNDAIDTRIKATVTTTMYDMTRVTANGYFDTDDNPDARYALRQALNTQRTADYKAGTYQRAGGVVDPVPADAPFFVKDYHDYYKTPRGYHPRSLNSTGGWNVTSPPVAAQRKAARLRRRDPQRRARHPR